MKKQKAIYITMSALIAALYVVLTYVSYSFGISGSAVQCRISEALCVLAAYTPAAIPGLAVGCAVANILTEAHIIDVILGSIATFAAAYVTYKIRKYKFFSSFPAILFNTAVIPPILIYVYGISQAAPLVFASVAIGEAISCGILGGALIFMLEKTKSGIQIKKQLENL